MENEQNKTASKQEQLDAKQMQLATGAKINQELSNQNNSLEAQKALDERYEEAQNEFSKGEAEVYKQGDTLMIRLRGLEFPVSQAVIKGSNFPLLAKVQKVIKNFGPSTVVVEGHTDSVGGKAANQKLSSARAETVKEYLASINQGQPLNIKAVGYGYQKPLGTNRTAAGRAQNRRVDILIQPEEASESITK
jgi:outer membrane protein OmpA-like peptidoglycan-associated protein